MTCSASTRILHGYLCYHDKGINMVNRATMLIVLTSTSRHRTLGPGKRDYTSENTMVIRWPILLIYLDVYWTMKKLYVWGNEGM